MARKRATGTTGMAGVNTTYEPKNKGSVTASAGRDVSGSAAPSGTMGASESGGKPRISQGGDAGGISAGRSRTNKGRNSAGAGRPQGFSR